MQMTTKRPRSQLEEFTDQPNSQRRRSSTLSFANVIKEVMTVNSFQNFAARLEPLVRRVVREEVERSLRHGLKSLQRYPSNKWIEVAEPSPLKLVFGEGLTLPIFTGSKIGDDQGNHLKLSLVDTFGGRAHLLPPSLKIEIVVVDGDFVSDGRETWTRDEFNRSVLREREGRRPLLCGEVALTMRDGTASLGELSLTDNSSWVRSRCFRIGARVVDGTCPGLRVQEAITQRFTVKDHRGELYKKSYPPTLNDEVWRLEKIAKDGAFHQRLSAGGINTVQDFLKLWAVNSQELRKILGQGMSDRMWEATIVHAKACVRGDKLYAYHRADGCSAVVNAVCEPVFYLIEGLVYTPGCHLPIQLKALADRLVLEAYLHWNELEAYRGPLAKDELLPSMSIGCTPPHQDGLLIPTYETEFEFNVMGPLPENPDLNYFEGWAGLKSDHPASDAPRSLVSKAPEFSPSDDEGSSLSHPFLLS